nr:hypothetical protein [Xanthomonas axonopodis]
MPGPWPDPGPSGGHRLQ